MSGRGASAQAGEFGERMEGRLSRGCVNRGLRSGDVYVCSRELSPERSSEVDDGGKKEGKIKLGCCSEQLANFRRQISSAL